MPPNVVNTKGVKAEASMLDLSNASGILRLLRTFMLTIKTREFGVLNLLITGCMRVKHPNVEKGILAIVTLVFCSKLYIKPAVSLCSFSEFSFPFNLQKANALVLKFGTLQASQLSFLEYLVRDFDILFRSTVLYRKMDQN